MEIMSVVPETTDETDASEDTTGGAEGDGSAEEDGTVGGAEDDNAGAGDAGAGE